MPNLSTDNATNNSPERNFTFQVFISGVSFLQTARGSSGPTTESGFNLKSKFTESFVIAEI